MIILLLVIGATAGSVAAQSREQERRIEEDKREDLRFSTPEVSPPVPSSVATNMKDDAIAPIPQALEPLYFMSLAHKRFAFRYDAMMGILIVLGLDEEYISLNSQSEYFQKNNLLPPKYRESFDSMQPLRRGLVAYMFGQALKIRGGIALSLFGPSERYSMKELGSQGIMSPGLVNDLISGEELIQIITQAANYQAKRLSKQKP